MNEQDALEINKKWSPIISSEIQKLKQGLGMSEEEFFSFDPKKSEKCLQWWMYSILDDLMRFQIKTIGMEDDLHNPEGQIKDDEEIFEEMNNGLNMKRLLFENYLFELEFWHRKFLEHFIQLIHLSNIQEANRDQTAKIYLLAADLLEFANRLKDDKFSYGIENEAELEGFNIEFEQMKILVDDLGDCIFLDKNFNEKNARGLKVFSSYKFLYDEIFKKKLATENDRLLLGGTYYHYHKLTQSIHAHGHNNKQGIEIEDILKNINHIFLLNFKILYYIGIITGLNSSHYIELFATTPLEGGMDFTVQKYERGDLVLFGGILYEVIDILKTENTGYYKIQIQTKSGIWTSTRWVRQENQYLKHVLYIGNSRSTFSSLEDVDPENKEFILSMTDDMLFIALKSTILELYKNGINVFSGS